MNYDDNSSPLRRPNLIRLAKQINFLSSTNTTSNNDIIMTSTTSSSNSNKKLKRCNTKISNISKSNQQFEFIENDEMNHKSSSFNTNNLSSKSIFFLL